ncbi:Pycsar system effector family protein [Ichthyenterobacterium magnum]|uniref:Putative metal-dependent HD superfamily phosphohydrolase n=1 Tax=Ichthyenterobacterium magnum TaxID=1230530 RepID=A0A420DW47_9FLAO|nr:Pycsar system effector family protein [Ichthyenterobacterium magnum]RKE98442.1 putative metal-dependent HD superfamily phosphohydrolase [Ichthyenterobacterium magnum]
MDTLIAKTESYVVNFLNENLDKSFIYHNLAHTKRVVEKAQELADGEQIEPSQKDLLILASWFHDVGFAQNLKKHETHSVAIAKDFLKSQNQSEADIKTVSDLIMATQMGHEPQNILEKIIQDADCSHIGSKNFSDLTELLRKEWELTCDKTLTESEWLKENIDFLSNHHRFYTDFASSNWEKTKGKNLARLLKSQKKLTQDSIKLKQKKEELAFKKTKVELPERGIETMFRVALRNHITLSDIADTKANILLSVNAIIISLVLSNLVSKLDNPSNDYLIWPTVIFTLFTVASIVLSVLATRPNVTQGKFNKQDVADKKVNLLFFGNFHKMNLDEFEWAMHEMMKDRDYLYGSLTKDLYFLGLVLNRKYNLLRLTYTVFMIGIVISVLSFAVAFYLQSL